MPPELLGAGGGLLVSPSLLDGGLLPLLGLLEGDKPGSPPPLLPPAGDGIGLVLSAGDGLGSLAPLLLPPAGDGLGLGLLLEVDGLKSLPLLLSLAGDESGLALLARDGLGSLPLVAGLGDGEVPLPEPLLVDGLGTGVESALHCSMRAVCSKLAAGSAPCVRHIFRIVKVVYLGVRQERLTQAHTTPCKVNAPKYLTDQMRMMSVLWWRHQRHVSLACKRCAPANSSAGTQRRS